MKNDTRYPHRDSLRQFLKIIRTGPLGLRDALIAALAYVDGSVPYVDPSHVMLLRDHTGGWFGKAEEVKKLIEEVRELEREAYIQQYKGAWDAYG